MADKPFVIKKQAHFDNALAAIIKHQEVREDFERAIHFALSNFPECGKNTGRAAPIPVYAWTFHKTERNPAVIVYYCYAGDSVLLLNARETENDVE